ncbi:hypothetical protein DXG03_004756 [Asterophora parasitica]|uniref:Uncharacterized protein n=1 Tax=Asterophora parasitica TaxID=117018 RepID=A0A9P7GAH3_9AGAR|nr:hypothetical protein DXG03_004756 [Asterophora parasitica]
MDIDPLADTVPPRHALESDEEEDEYNPLRPSNSQSSNQVADVKILGQLPPGRNLVIATGDVAKYWARGAELGEQSGAVYVNNIQVGLMFNPSWTKNTIIISEALTRLPPWAMHPYASTILDSLKPSKVSLLDTYAAPSYITEDPVPLHDAPLRYLATASVVPAVKSAAEPYAPPNLIQSTSASLLSLIAFFALPSAPVTASEGEPGPPTSTATAGTLILVPSPHIPHAPPKVLEPNNFTRLAEDRFEWPESTVNAAQELVFAAFDNEERPPRWVYRKERGGEGEGGRRRRDVGDGGMYI